MSTTDFAGDGRMVKRKFRPGWHIDLSARKNLVSNSLERPEPITANEEVPAFDHRGSTETASIGSRASGIQTRPEHSALIRPDRSITTPDHSKIGRIDHGSVIAMTKQDEQENLMPKKKWNHWAIPSFLAALGTTLLALTTLDLVAVAIGIVVTLTLAGIALRRGRVHELAGKGFAIAALIIGVIALLFTAISIASFGI